MSSGAAEWARQLEPDSEANHKATEATGLPFVLGRPPPPHDQDPGRTPDHHGRRPLSDASPATLGSRAAGFQQLFQRAEVACHRLLDSGYDQRADPPQQG